MLSCYNSLMQQTVEKDKLAGDAEVGLSSYHPLLQKLLVNRNIITANKAEAFLNPDYEDHLHDPF